MRQLDRVIRLFCAGAALAILTAAAPLAQVGKSQGVMDINTMSESDIGALPNLTPAMAKALVAKRPFLSIVDLNAFLVGQGLTPEQAMAVYPTAFVHINLNTATAEEIILVPGAGRRMVREFPEYRPWKSWAQFEREIGKYLGRGETGAENARKLAQYTFIPMHANTAGDADLLNVPGATPAWVAKFKAGRPYKTAHEVTKVAGNASARFFVVE